MGPLPTDSGSNVLPFISLATGDHAKVVSRLGLSAESSQQRSLTLLAFNCCSNPTFYCERGTGIDLQNFGRFLALLGTESLGESRSQQAVARIWPFAA